MTAHYDSLFGALDDGPDWFPSPAHVLRRAAILELVQEWTPGRLVDMGCGAGRWLIEWDRLGHTGTGVELDEQTSLLADGFVRAFDARFDVVSALGESAVGRYDYMSAIEVLEHVESPLTTLKDWSRYLKAGGLLIASVPAFERLWGASDEWAGHVQRFEPDAFCKLVEDAGFTVLKSKLYGFPVANMTRIFGNLSSDLKRRRRQPEENERHAATRASGRDRSTEVKLKSLLLSPVTAGLLRLGVAAQKRFKKSGIGVIVLAQKTQEVAQNRQSLASGWQ